MILYFLAHVFSDFIVQSQGDVNERRDRNLSGNVRHIKKVILVYVIFSIVYIWFVQEWNWTIILPIGLFILINVISHFIIDLAKTALSKKFHSKAIWMFLVDQIIHFVIIAILYRLLLDAYVITLFPTYYLMMLFFLSLATFVSAVFIKHLLNYFDLDDNKHASHEKVISNQDSNKDVEDTDKTQENNDGDSIRHGWWIGIIERSIMFLALVFNFMGLLTVVIAFKTVSRYPEFKKNPDYYIIGNLLSILFVLVSFGVFRVIV